MFLHPSHTVVLVIYVDPTLFVLATSIIVHGLGLNSSHGLCEGAIILCLVCYMTTKIVIYYFLVERAYVVRGSRKPRLKTKLWLFNCLSMMLPYTVFVIMNFIWRITYISEKGVCIIGMQKIAMLPLITFEVVVNIYLTLLFILPLRSKPPPPPASKTRGMGAVLHKSRDDDSESGDELGLRKIHVDREVCIDSENGRDGEFGHMQDMRSPSVEDAWGMKRCVSAEKMV